MRKIIVLILLVALLIPVFLFSASADTLSVSGCYYVDAYDFCELLSTGIGYSYNDVEQFFSLINQYVDSLTHAHIYVDIIGVDCIKYNDALYFDRTLYDLVSDFRFSSSLVSSSIYIDGSEWVSIDANLPYEFELYRVDPWPDVAPFITVVPSSPEYIGIADLVSDSGINSVLDYVLVILPFAVGALVAYISVRKGIGYLRTVINRS